MHTTKDKQAPPTFDKGDNMHTSTRLPESAVSLFLSISSLLLLGIMLIACGQQDDATMWNEMAKQQKKDYAKQEPPKQQERSENRQRRSPEDSFHSSSWEHLPPESKASHMKRAVLPDMQKLFYDFDPKRYSGKGLLHCQTCHGEEKAHGDFDFKKPSLLYPLDPKNMPSENDPDPKKAAMVRFMRNKILPRMRQLLQQPQLTCFNCHAVKKH